MPVYDELTATGLMLSHSESQTGGIESMVFRHHTERNPFSNQLSYKYKTYALSLPSVSAYDSGRRHVDGCPAI